MLANLEALDISFNQLVKLPDSVGNLRMLRHLNVGFNPLGHDMPHVIPKLKRLVTLNLDFTGVATVPLAMGALSDLVELGMEGNPLEEPFRGLYAKHPLLLVHAFNPDVTHLDLSNCNLHELPESIGTLTALRSLNLSNNVIVDLHEGLGKLVGLTELKLDGNPLARIWHQLRSAEGHSDLDVVPLLNPKAPALGLSKCKFMDVPVQVKPHDRYLGKLDLSDNKLAILPPWISDFSVLHTLILSE